MQLVAKRSARFTLLHDGSTAPDSRDGLLSCGGNQNRYFVSCPHLSTEPICFPNNRAWFRFADCIFSVRGHALGSCPITNLFEVLVFLAWSIALIYLLIGTTYRLSLMGAFTAPLVVLLQLAALLLPIDTPRAFPIAPNPWLEFHASISIIAYGAFALACVAGAMYLVQERQLKTHQLRSIFYHCLRCPISFRQ